MIRTVYALVSITGSICYLLNLVPESRKVELHLIKSLSLLQTHLQVALTIILNLRADNLLAARNLPQYNTIRIIRQLRHQQVHNARRLVLPIVAQRRSSRLKITRCQHFLLQNFKVFLHHSSAGFLRCCLGYIGRGGLVILSVEVISLDDLLLANFSIVGLLRYLLLGHPTLELLIIA